MRNIVLPAVLLALLAAPVAADETNLLPNGSFEDGLESWVFAANSGRATANVQRKVKKKGKRALHIEKQGGMPFDVLRTDIRPVKPGTSVEVSAQVKGKDVGNAFVKFWVYDEAGQSLVQDVDIVQLRGSFKWKRVAKTYDLPEGAASAAVMILMVMGGELWIDDVRVEGAAGPEPLPEDMRAWLDTNAAPLASLAFDASPDDLVPLGEAMGERRVVLLGEESHGDGPAFQVKARLVKHLHEHHGFDVVAFEAGLFDCETANALLAEGKVREAMFASVHGVWRVEEVRPLFEYIAARAKTERPLRLTGFDPQATGGAALELGDRLGAVLGDDAFPPSRRDAIRGGIERIWEGKATSKDRKALLAALDHARTPLADRREALVAAHGEGEIALLEIAVDNLEFWTKARAKPASKGWAAVNARDARMAENFLWLTGTRYPTSKVVGWGATMHFMHGAKSIREGGKRPYQGCTPMGQTVYDALKDDVYVLGFVAHHGDKGTPFWGPFPIPAPPPDSIEDVLHRYGRPWLFVDLTAAKGPLRGKRQAGPLGYSRTMTADWGKILDGLVFTDVNVPSSPLGP